jgi:hypothetical protein
MFVECGGAWKGGHWRAAEGLWSGGACEGGHWRTLKVYVVWMAWEGGL